MDDLFKKIAKSVNPTSQKKHLVDIFSFKPFDKKDFSETRNSDFYIFSN